ncbi:MAG: hypothetical protein ACFFDK_08040 [Promethearchaeota archaeon]
MTSISKVLEIENCPKDKLIAAIYVSKFWEELSPVSKIEVNFVSPNVFHSIIVDNIKVVNIPIEMEGELVLTDKGEEEGKGRLIEFNVRNNKNVKKLDGNMRIKALSPYMSKVGVFVHNFSLEDDFLRLFGGAAELTLRTKISNMLRNLERFCKTNDLNEFL